jgi:wobble nucleotide-excising tRNase
MMLDKIILIKNVGRFRNSAAGGDTSLAKHTLIHGANGFGKTTICTILRSLRTADPSYVLGRKTLGTIERVSIELRVRNGTIRFDGDEWSAPYPELAIFDAVFVTENVHAGDVVDTEQKRSLYRVIVGEEGVSLAEKEAQLVGNSRSKTADIGTVAKAIQSHVAPGMKLESFIACRKQKISTS